MIVLALLLLIAAAVLVVFIVVTGRTQTVGLTWDTLNLEWSPSALVVFLLGALTLLLLVLALGLLRGGTKRKVEQRRELKRLRGVERENAAAADDDRRAGGTSGAAAGGAPTAGGTRAEPRAHDSDSGYRSSAQDQPTRQHDQPTRHQSTNDQSTHDQPIGDRPAQEHPIYPRKTGPGQGTGSGQASRGSWHDEPGGDRPSGRHEAP